MCRLNVAPPAGAWIETPFGNYSRKRKEVAPPAGAWIETGTCVRTYYSMASHPLRVRGLKLTTTRIMGETRVAPPAGAWIETGSCSKSKAANIVAPPAGAWIETVCLRPRFWGYTVAPPAGAWIETQICNRSRGQARSHPLRVRGLKRQCEKMVPV